MKRNQLLKICGLTFCFAFFHDVAFATPGVSCPITDPAVLIKQMKNLENSVGAARLLKEMDLVIKELHSIINVETAPEIEDPTQPNNNNFGNSKKETATLPRKKRNKDIELEMTIIPEDELNQWAKPLLTKKIKKTMEEYGIVNAKGEINYRNSDVVKKTREFVSDFLIPPEIKSNNDAIFTSDKQKELKEYIANAHISASADAYAISLLAQYRLANFDEVILTPFREDLEASEDLMDRFRKNTWAILGLMSQMNLSNIRSAANLSLQATQAMKKLDVSGRIKTYQARERALGKAEDLVGTE